MKAARLVPSAALLVLAAAPLASAHPGHDGGLLGGLLHPLTGLDHLLAMVMIGVLGVRLADRRFGLALPAAFAAAMLPGVALGSIGLLLPGAETAVSLSVIIIGGVIALRGTPSASLAFAVAVPAGLVHGYVHGVEMPADAAAFVIGMLASTVTLHTLGFAAAAILTRHAHGAALRTAAAALSLAFAAAWLAGV